MNEQVTQLDWGKAEVVLIPVDDIAVDESQPRNEFVDESIRALAESIRLVGLVQPITVRPNPTVGQDGKKWRIVSGERRYRAVCLLGWESIRGQIVSDPVLNEMLFAVQVLENTAREDLNPIDRAKAFHTLLGEGYTEQKVAQTAGTTIANVRLYISLLDLRENVRALVEKKHMNVTVAGALAQLSHNGQQKALNAIVSNGMGTVEARMLCERLRGVENQDDMFPETVVSEKSKKLAEDFNDFVAGFGRLMTRLEALDEKEQGAMVAALSPASWLVKARIAAMKQQLTSIERRLDEHQVASVRLD